MKKFSIFIFGKHSWQNLIFSNLGTLENDVYLEHLESISSTNNDIVGSAKTRSSIAGGGESGVGMFFFVIGLIILLAGIGAIFYFR